MIDVISQRMREQLQYGKYTRWAERLSTESLESLLCAVGVFGGLYNAAKSTTGKRTRSRHLQRTAWPSTACEELSM